MAGTIAAVGNNAIGVAGVMWKASIMPLKFLDSSGVGNSSDAIEAIQYAINKGAFLTITVGAEVGMNLPCIRLSALRTASINSLLLPPQ